MPASLLTTDLMTASQAEGAAIRAGRTLRTAADAEALLRQAGETSPPLVIVDLSAPGVDVAGLVFQLRNLKPTPKIVAFGPHVHEERLAEATRAGCDLVLSRGQFHAQAEELLKQWGD